MEKNSIPRCEVILCISDATISPQLLEVIKCFKANNVDQHILIMATEFNPLLESIRLLGVSFEVLPLVSKFGLGKTALAILFRLLRNRPNTFISSGQFATLSGIPAAFFLQIRKRIYIYAIIQIIITSIECILLSCLIAWWIDCLLILWLFRG